MKVVTAYKGKKRKRWKKNKMNIFTYPEAIIYVNECIRILREETLACVFCINKTPIVKLNPIGKKK